MKISTVVTIFGFLENHAGSASRYFLISFYFIQLDKLGLNLGKYSVHPFNRHSKICTVL